MVTEIELKYFVTSDNTQEKITQLFTTKQLSFSCETKQLSNCYYDTTNLDFRRHDMGLRIRGCDGKLEQTIKTAGVVIAGLHQRPEYNVNIVNNFPELSLFPNEIWQSTQKVEQLQETLIPLFSTDFTRIIWLVTLSSGTVVEVAFDQGDISSDGRSVKICELELELVSGITSDLLLLAKLLFSVLLVRPSSQSKAARGYGLWKNIPVNYKKNITDTLPIDRSHSISNAFSTGINYCLVNLHDHIEYYITSPSLVELEKITETLALIRHGFWLFADYLPEEAVKIRDELSYFVHLLSWVDNAVNLQELTNKTGNYRRKLNYSEQLVEQLRMEKRRLPTSENVIELLHGQRFNTLQAHLLEMLLTEDKQFSDSLLPFAQQSLTKSMAVLFADSTPAQSLSSEQYLSQAKLLNRSLLTGTWFGLLFDEEERKHYRAPWLDIQQGISELQTLWIIHQQLQTLDEKPKKLVLWQGSKVEGLLIALDSSRNMALLTKPYWLDES
ncbi:MULTISPECIES: CYTH domain-containing protein [unclassified Colwellia]|uniref:CYTH and CHAD domain-containing protein n=1 Tax=unclassified Colwellia TaxID=196834 RepID=UPI0015F48E95|nr:MULTISPECIES: CYTH domain-containing protein [unclassified Colwellia]MBA6354563.1 inorganic triphosphatase [Colwellia sp. BRX8-3]MBA6361327.1 inorganic triphosphatase [Colwellia sp. BRX8-6]MBA6366077.1 inorganic triphosphatase [Colwellia sp. BRX8-5]MBA6377409.1 inorganic triphosphatase [Colwellia sp. BRX8-2]